MEKIRNAFLNWYQNPFDLEEVHGDLVNIVTVHIATKEEESLSAQHETGMKKMSDFAQKRLTETSLSVSFS